jgi:hypothetical protein
MTKLKVLSITIGLAIVLSFSLLLYYKINNKKEFLKEKGFVRKFLYDRDVSLKFKVDLKEDDYKCLGYAKKRIFLYGHRNRTLVILSDSMPLYENLIVSFDTLLKKQIEISNTYLDTLMNKVYFFSNTERSIYEYDFHSRKITNVLKLNLPFQNGFKTNTQEYILTQQVGKELKFSFYSYRLNNQLSELRATGKESNLQLKNMIDDGRLIQANQNYLVYVSYFKNPVFLLDSNLKVVAKFKTIDTISVGPSVVFIGANGTGTLKYTSALRITNQNFIVSSGTLFVNSLVKGENENNKDFKNNNVIDTYNLNEYVNYVGSYYFPKLENMQITDFYILDNKLFFIYPETIILYETSNNL